MKSFLKYFIIFISPIFIAGICSELLLRNIPNDYSYKSKYLDRNSKNVTALFLGSSHIYFGINPEFMSSKSFNAAHTSQSLDFDLKILEKYKNHWNSLKYIVVPVDYFSLYSRLDTGIEAWRVKNYSIYYNIKINNNLSENTEILSNKLNIKLNRLYQFYINDKSDISCSNLGWGFNYSSKNNQNLELTGNTSAKRHLAKNNDYFNENVAVLKQIIEFAKINKCNVIFVTSPAYRSYVENLNKNQLNSTINEVTKLSNSNKNVVYINLLTDSSFVKEDFYDADHLNEIGTKKFTLKIDRIINSTYKIVN